MKKRFLSVLLCVCMVLTLTPTIAYAIDNTTYLQLLQATLDDTTLNVNDSSEMINGKSYMKTRLGYETIELAEQNRYTLTVPYDVNGRSLANGINLTFGVKRPDTKEAFLSGADEISTEIIKLASFGSNDPDKNVNYYGNEVDPWVDREQVLKPRTPRTLVAEEDIDDFDSDHVTKQTYYMYYGNNYDYARFVVFDVVMEEPPSNDLDINSVIVGGAVTLSEEDNESDTTTGGSSRHVFSAYAPTDLWKSTGRKDEQSLTIDLTNAVTIMNHGNNLKLGKQVKSLKKGINVIETQQWSKTSDNTLEYYIDTDNGSGEPTQKYTLKLVNSGFFTHNIDTPALGSTDELEQSLQQTDIKLDDIISSLKTLVLDDTLTNYLSSEAYKSVADKYSNEDALESGLAQLNDNQIDRIKNPELRIEVQLKVDGLKWNLEEKSLGFNVKATWNLILCDSKLKDLKEEVVDDNDDYVIIDSGLIDLNNNTDETCNIKITVPESLRSSKNLTYVKFGDNLGYEKTRLSNSVLTLDLGKHNTFAIKGYEGIASVGKYSFDSLQSAVDFVAQNPEDNTILLNSEPDSEAIVTTPGKYVIKKNKTFDGQMDNDKIKLLLKPGDGVELIGDENPTGSVNEDGLVFEFTEVEEEATTVIAEESENGKVDLSSTTAKAEETVTITPTPNEGYLVDEVTVTDKKGNDIEETDNKDGTYSFTMPAEDAQPVTVSVTFKKDDSSEPAPGPDTEQNPSFTDAPAGAWYSEAVNYVTSKGLMKGTSGTTFDPDMKTSRGMVVTILHRLEGEPSAAPASFNDVPSGQWYSDAVNWATANSIVSGYGNGNFGPNDIVTREGIATILYRYATVKGYDTAGGTDLSKYVDSAAVSSYAVDAMNWAVTKGLINGTSTTTPTLSPAGDTSRAEIATILTRFCEQIAK